VSLVGATASIPKLATPAIVGAGSVARGAFGFVLVVATGCTKALAEEALARGVVNLVRRVSSCEASGWKGLGSSK
jgi:hypothetical protein